MTNFYGTKRLSAEPMTRQAYNDFRGWTLPADEHGADEGYLVEYQDGGKSFIVVQFEGMPAFAKEMRVKADKGMS